MELVAAAPALAAQVSAEPQVDEQVPGPVSLALVSAEPQVDELVLVPVSQVQVSVVLPEGAQALVAMCDHRDR
jgi:hypothetical protein